MADRTSTWNNAATVQNENDQRRHALEQNISRAENERKRVEKELSRIEDELTKATQESQEAQTQADQLLYRRVKWYQDEIRELERYADQHKDRIDELREEATLERNQRARRLAAHTARDRGARTDIRAWIARSEHSTAADRLALSQLTVEGSHVASREPAAGSLRASSTIPRLEPTSSTNSQSRPALVQQLPASSRPAGDSLDALARSYAAASRGGDRAAYASATATSGSAGPSVISPPESRVRWDGGFPETASRYFPIVVRIDECWQEISCRQCGNNSHIVDAKLRYFVGVKDLQKHVKDVHKLPADLNDLDSWCRLRKLSDNDADSVRQESFAREVPITKKYSAMPPQQNVLSEAGQASASQPKLKKRPSTSFTPDENRASTRIKITHPEQADESDKENRESSERDSMEEAGENVEPET
ncbi:hypothetical protein Slin15195_G076580 [Septoria linicola]|uniref:Uncharacterized protein n=1 Tax=Septoria linicola TaxID=215465 RepID=A0A9Q9ATD1_9PEZI|nr:hypothetical protein Slin15195_G076580 [Septoria linicola]